MILLLPLQLLRQTEKSSSGPETPSNAYHNDHYYYYNNHDDYYRRNYNDLYRYEILFKQRIDDVLSKYLFHSVILIPICICIWYKWTPPGERLLSLWEFAIAIQLAYACSVVIAVVVFNFVHMMIYSFRCRKTIISNNNDNNNKNTTAAFITFFLLF